jgi:hypothetical protein
VEVYLLVQVLQQEQVELEGVVLVVEQLMEQQEELTQVEEVVVLERIQVEVQAEPAVQESLS